MEDLKYFVHIVQCDLCSYKWIAVYPCVCEKLQCPNCDNISYFNILSLNKKDDELCHL